MTSPTKSLSTYFSGLDIGDAPQRVVHEAKRFVIDTLGCLLAATNCELSPIINQSAALFGGGSEATIPGAGKANLLGAIYANARLANALDFDETFPVGAHFGIGAFASALGLAQKHNLSGREFLNCILAGYEFGGRVASYIGPVVQIRDGRVTGFPSVWGVAAPVVFAATMASARARHMSPEMCQEAIGVAGCNAPLPAGAQWSGAVDLPNSKYCDAGWCAVTGTFAALSAELGSTGFSSILDGNAGLARMYGVEKTEERWLTEGLGTVWMFDDITYKPWPTCRFTHYPLTALERLLQDHAIDVSKIEKIVIETGPLAASKRFTNPSPRTFASRQFSYPHMVAMRLLNVEPGAGWLVADQVKNPAAVALKNMTSIEMHPRGDTFAQTFSRNQIRTMPGGIRITVAGKTYRAESDFAKGDPWDETTKFSDQDVIAKFKSATGRTSDDRLIDQIFNLEKLPTIEPIVDGLNQHMREYADA